LDFHFQPRDHGFPVDEFASNGARGEICDLRGCHINNNYTLTIAPTDCGNSRMPLDHLAADQ